MQAVILAAGRGSRMNDPESPPKLLLNLHDQTLLEHNLNALSSIGVTRFVVVVGHRGEMVEDFIASKNLTRRFDLCVAWNDRWWEGSASSILAARSHLMDVDDRFVLMMGDHLFDSEGLRGLLKVQGDLVGVFDSTPRFVDVDEATKAASCDGFVTAIGKELGDFQYIDAGVFLCSHRIFPFIEECMADGLSTFNEVKQRWIAEHALQIFDCQGAFWVDVDTLQELEKARALLRERVGKPRDGLVARLLNRRLSMPISRWLVQHTQITPNQISVGAFVFTLVPMWLFSFGPGVFSVIAGLLAQLISIVDGCDGEVARLRHMSTAYGAWLDALLDRLADALVIGGMTYGAWRSHGASWVWLLGFAALVGSFAISYTEARYEGAFGQPPAFGDGLPAKRDMRLFLIMLGGVTGQLIGALGLIAVLTTGEVIRRLWTKTAAYIQYGRSA